ncbi:MAG: aspartyl/glutamyl-tRNA amidotransferase subunit A, partial [Phycisphaerales bacterium]|nr:aspartyl/glutamyl-tRNA amidotransferase subunit A [Phycisphaerales bacterium]
LGSDTGGSIRQPAAYCGCVGFKPTYGRISRWGLVAFGSSLDQIGPLTHSVRDAALLYSVMAGVDRRDGTSTDLPVGDPLADVDRGVEGLRIGVAREYLSDRNNPEISARVEQTLEKLRSQGAEPVELELPLTDHGISTYYVLAPAEASSNLARYDGIRYGYRAENIPGESLEDLYSRTRSEGFGPEVQRRIMLGTYVLSAGYYDAYYKRALQVRRLIKNEFDRAFEDCDVILGPTAPTPAFRLDEQQDPLSMYLNDVYTVNANIAGICAMSVPTEPVIESDVALPVGLHLQAPAFDEVTLFRAASAVERLGSTSD